MKLDPLDIEVAVPQAHDQAVGTCGGYDEILRQRGPVDNQGVVAGRLEGVGQSGEDADPFVADLSMY